MIRLSHIVLARRAIAALLLTCPALVHAQQGRAPARPALGAGADTNDAREYIRFATAALPRDPAAAAAGFYWACRLEPTLAEAWYGLHAARLVENGDTLLAYMDGDTTILSRAGVKQIDSLRLRALMLDPFMAPQFEAEISIRYVYEYGGRHGRVFRLEDVRRTAERTGFATAGGRFALAATDITEALESLARAARREPRDYGYLTSRAYIFVLAGHIDSAAAAMDEAIRLAHERDTTRMRYSYQSKEFMQFQRARIAELAGDTARAMTAYQAALVENLGFWPAHTRLALLAAARGDTATAVREFDAALLARDDAYDARLQYGWLLAATGRLADAIPHLERAARIEPWAAAPWDLLGQIHDAAGRRAEALNAYQAFLSRARRNDPGRGPVAQRLTALRAN